MGHIVADETMESRLRGIVEPVEIRDSQGRVLGQYTPYVSDELPEAYAKAIASFDREEIERRLAAHKSGEGLSMKQVLA